MKQVIEINLNELIEVGKTDSISGRSFGQGYAEKIHLIEEINLGKTFKIIIPPNEIKAINDSFLKGFFSIVFEKYKSKPKVKEFFEFETSVAFLSLIDKNLTILDAIYNP